MRRRCGTTAFNVNAQYGDIVNRASYRVIEGQYLQDILDQPQAMAATLQGLRSREDLLAIKGQFSGKPIERIILTGMGSSLHALYPLELMLNGHGQTAFIVETSELIHYMPAC